MTTVRTSGSLYAFKRYLASLSQIPPVQNNWYTVLDTTIKPTLVFMMDIYQRNDEAAAKNLDARVTIEGTAITETGISAANNTSIYLFLARYQGAFAIGTSTDKYNIFSYSNLEAHKIKVEVRITSALGTNQQLKSNVDYGLLEGW